MSYATYTKFFSPEDAQLLVSLLQRQNIPYTLHHEVNPLDKVYAGDSIDPMFALQIPGQYFNQVNDLLADLAKADMAQPGFEHQLQADSVEELQAILKEPIGWSAYDLQVAKSLLAEKAGTQALAEAVKERPYVPASVGTHWIVLGYLICILALAAIFYFALDGVYAGFAITAFYYFTLGGFFAGLAITQAKKRLPNGHSVKMFDASDVRHGRNMIIISLASITIGVVLIFNRYY